MFKSILTPKKIVSQNDMEMMRLIFNYSECGDINNNYITKISFGELMQSIKQETEKLHLSRFPIAFLPKSQTNKLWFQEGITADQFTTIKQHLEQTKQELQIRSVENKTRCIKFQKIPGALLVDDIKINQEEEILTSNLQFSAICFEILHQNKIDKKNEGRQVTQRCQIYYVQQKELNFKIELIEYEDDKGTTVFNVQVLYEDSIQNISEENVQNMVIGLDLIVNSIIFGN